MKTVKARWFTPGRTSKPRVIVIHDMEAPETDKTAENVAAYFARGTAKASAHVCVDSNSAVRCVPDSDTAWCAPGANHDGLHIELAGYARQTKAEWLDAYGKAMLKRAAAIAADWCRKYDIPAERLTVAGLKAGKRGFVGHVDVSNAYRKSDHSDPGPSFPWNEFLVMVRAALVDEAAPVKVDSYLPPAFPAGLKPGRSKPSAKPLQRALKAAGFMPQAVKEADNYGPETQKAVKAFHGKYPDFSPAKNRGLDSAINAKGWAKLFTLAYGRKK